MAQACPLCGRAADRRLLGKGAELQPSIAHLIARTAREWTPQDGLCPACAHLYAQRLAAQRSRTSLHTTTEPNTTLPYYHPAEETVLGQPLRLPDYAAFSGAGVTIAFLDSGYYPHPDLTVEAGWGGQRPAWHRLSQPQLRAAISQAGLRLVEYVDLTDAGERVGLQQPSLWDGAGDSWHGQMTTAIAAGNGLLSDGRLRGYAPGASLLPIKIGRGGGRIPEEDILRGLDWLLRDDHWQRFDVRVVNISVGGDFPQDRQDNPVCRAAHALAQRGVVVAAAAGNRGIEELLAPAQTPTVITVGGVDDHNRRWRPSLANEVEQLTLYPHNFGTVMWQHAPVRKPEILALGRWLPSPVLPPSLVFRETHAIDRLRSVLLGGEEDHLGALLHHWGHTLHDAPSAEDVGRGSDVAIDDAQWMPEVWQGLRKRMNAHKWVHPYYQHVDGTSVAVAQVSAVAAQMLQANPRLHPDDVRRLLCDTSLALPHLLPRQTGAGLLQPALAVAAALRTAGGPLLGFPRSGTHLRDDELQKWTVQGKLTVLTLEEQASLASGRNVYFGHLAPRADSVSLIGSFNRWQPGLLPLQRAANGWWHAAVHLPPGNHLYRFWIEDADHPEGVWRRDPENPDCVESGYADGHSCVMI